MIVYGNQDVQVPAHINFGKHILDNLRKIKPDHVCLQDGTTGEKITVTEFIQHAVNLSAALSELGVKRGDIVGIGSEKRSLFMPTALAILLTGAAYTPFESRSGRAALKHKLSLANPGYFICSRLFWEKYSDILKDLDSIQFYISFDDIKDVKISLRTLITRQVDVASFEPALVQGQTDPAVILYSSGTTGMPKALEITHLSCILRSKIFFAYDNIINNIFIAGEWCNCYDIFAFFMNICSGWKVVIYLTNETPDAVIKCCQDYQVHTMVVEPMMLAYLAKSEEVIQYDLSSLKIIYSSGSPLYPETIEAVKQKLPGLSNVQGYGSSEMGSCTSLTLDNHKDSKNGSVGLALPGVCLKIVDPKTREILGQNQRGEICVRSYTVIKDYKGINVTAFTDSQGFYYTGDVGYFDEDNYLYIVDRLKNIFKYEGDQVSPAELESVLQRHPGVREAGVVGRPAGDLGELPTAFVVRQPGSQVSEQELQDYVSAEVPPHMQLRGGVRFVSDLPRNSRNKILHYRLQDMLG